MKVIKDVFNVYLQSLMDSLPEERLSEFILELRAGRPQRSFARTLGVSYNALRSWEMCESMPGVKSLEKISAYSGKSIEEILAYLQGKEKLEKTDFSQARYAEDLLPRTENLSKNELTKLVKLLVEKLANI